MNTLSLALAITVVALMVGAALVMTSGKFGIAGALFLSASIVIYLRETWV
jgi:hypothetical protein